MKPKNDIKITCETDYREIIILINGIEHIIYPRHKPIYLQAWYEGSLKEARIYKIELNNGEIETEFHYDNFDTWKQIINLIRKHR